MPQWQLETSVVAAVLLGRNRLVPGLVPAGLRWWIATQRGYSLASDWLWGQRSLACRHLQIPCGYLAILMAGKWPWSIGVRCHSLRAFTESFWWMQYTCLLPELNVKGYNFNDFITCWEHLYSLLFITIEFGWAMCTSQSGPWSAASSRLSKVGGTFLWLLGHWKMLVGSLQAQEGWPPFPGCRNLVRRAALCCDHGTPNGMFSYSFLSHVRDL